MNGLGLLPKTEELIIPLNPDLDRHSEMFYIIGVNHLVQSLAGGTTPTPENLHYASFLNNAILRLKPTLIAEEESRETLKGRNSIAEALALRFGTAHALCDPETESRRAIGYRGIRELKQRIRKKHRGILESECELRATAVEIGQEFSKREDYWISSIRGTNISTTIFICGDAHVDGFRRRLSERGIPSEVLARGLGMTDEQRKLIVEANLILKQDPNIDV
jgi:hypothetical protein